MRVKSNELIALSVVYSVLILVLVTNYSLINNENGPNLAYGFKSKPLPPSTTSPQPPTNNVTSPQQFQPSPQQFQPSPQPPTNNVTSPQQFQPSPQQVQPSPQQFQPSPQPPTNNVTSPQQFQPSPQPPTNNVTSPQQFQRQETVKPVIPVPKAPKGPPASFQAKGTINSVIAVPQKNWIATGNWIMTVNYGNLTGFRTNMSWVDQTGTATHTHQFLNFIPSPAFHVVVQQPKDTILVRGLMDVGTNNKVVWKDVPSVISIKGGKTISISVNDKATNSHFASQPILGVVKTYELCSDIPGPDMVVLPSCS